MILVMWVLNRVCILGTLQSTLWRVAIQFLCIHSLAIFSKQKTALNSTQQNGIEIFPVHQLFYALQVAFPKSLLKK